MPMETVLRATWIKSLPQHKIVPNLIPSNFTCISQENTSLQVFWQKYCMNFSFFLCILHFRPPHSCYSTTPQMAVASRRVSCLCCSLVATPSTAIDDWCKRKHVDNSYRYYTGDIGVVYICVFVNYKITMSDEEVVKFEITDYDLENEFNINRTRRISKNEQIYGKPIHYTFLHL